VVVEAPPGQALELTQPDILLEFFVILPDPPAQLGQVHPFRDGRLGRERLVNQIVRF
jgi:hypothetical protein